jgi:hypothetical protein
MIILFFALGFISGMIFTITLLDRIIMVTRETYTVRCDGGEPGA